MTAIWTAPRTWNPGDLAAATGAINLNVQVRDNLDWLKTPPFANAQAATDISTTSTTPVDMTNMSGTLTFIGTTGWCGFTAPFLSDTSRTLNINVYIDGVNAGVVAYREAVPVPPINVSWLCRFTGITPGSRTFTVRWSTSAGTMFQPGATNGNRIFFVSEFT